MAGTLSLAKIGRDVAKALIADRQDPDARATLAMELRSIISVIGFFADGSAIVNIGSGRWHVLIERGEAQAIRAGVEDTQHPAGTRMAKFIADIARMPSGGKVDQRKIERRLSSAASHRTSTK
jgi:hypothetical protein